VNDDDEATEGTFPDVKDSAGFSFTDAFYDPWRDE